MSNTFEEIVCKIEANLALYNLACENKNIEQELKQIQRIIKIKRDIPICLFGLLRELSLSKPQYYWKRDVASETEEIFEHYIKIDSDKFTKAFINSSTEFFEAIRAFENITDIITQLENVEFEEGYKTKLFRNPLFSQICEDYLMNLYRFIKNVLNIFSEKDYSNSNTLGAIIPILFKYGFKKSTNINTDLRNAVNHGNVFIRGTEVVYRYGKSTKEYKYNTLKTYEYDCLINETYDIGCGILIGIFKTLIKNPEIIELHYLDSEDNAQEWFRLIYKNPQINVLFLNSVSSVGNKQLNVNIKTTINNYDKLVFSLIELAIGAFIRFPNYDRYYIGFEHNRSTSGFIRFTSKQLSSSNEIAELYKMLLKSKDILIMPILDRNINENAFKYHVFPKIKSDNFTVEDIKDCSNKNHKRIKANVILAKKYSKKNLRIIIRKVILELSKLETPQNPYIETKYGKIKCDMVFINIFTPSYNRVKHNLYPNNDFFVCSAHYYKDTNCPKLENGGVMKSLWKIYKKEKITNINIAWNPRYKYEH